MPLESLLELVQTLSDRIDEHGPALRQSEALTRYALIDPLLRELGWDTANPKGVIPEYRSGNGRADYALMNNGSPAMMVEAKSLGTPLQDSVLAQGINYCLMEGTSYFSVTDGRLWEIYETHKPVPINDKCIVQFDLKGEPAQVCLKALALWRYSLETGQVIEAQTPVLPLSPDQPKPSPTLPAEKPTPQPASVIPLIDEGIDWQPLSEFNPVSGASTPTEISFPDNSTSTIINPKQILFEVVDWLQKNSLLDSSHCPIQLPNAKYRFIVNHAPVDELGRSRDKYEQIGQLFVEPRSSLEQIVRQAEYVIQHVGQDPSQFKVRLP